MKPSTPRLAQHKLRLVLAFIEDHLHHKMTATELASLVYISPFHFSRAFKASTGLPPHSFVTMRRMDLSKTLLASTELPLVEIALRVGYQTQAHFSGMFHRRVGTTPSAFRRVNRMARGEAAVARISPAALAGEQHRQAQEKAEEQASVHPG